MFTLLNNGAGGWVNKSKWFPDVASESAASGIITGIAFPYRGKVTP